MKNWQPVICLISYKLSIKKTDLIFFAKAKIFSKIGFNSKLRIERWKEKKAKKFPRPGFEP